MNLTLAICLFFVIAILYIVIIDIFTVFFKMTGMTDERARFQVISLLTNSGYTTKESEVVVEDLSRRKMARFIMLFGYVFSITTVSVFINVLLNIPEGRREEVWLPLLILGVILAVFLIVKSRPKVRAVIDKQIQKIGRRLIRKDAVNPVALMDEFDKGVVARVQINKMPRTLENDMLRAIGLPQNYGVRILFIIRNNMVLPEVNGEDTLREGDTLVVFGERDDIERAFAYRTETA